MSVQANVRIVAVVLLLLSYTLGRLLNPAWLWVAVLVGVNLIQSAFTGFCPVESFFRAIGRRKG